MNRWSRVRFGDLLRRSDETINLLPHVEYRQITVKLWGKGVVLRGTSTGAEIASARQMVTRAGQFILSRIDARNGAMGIVPPGLDGAVVSNDFPVFAIDESRLLPSYLGWICRSSSFVEECRRASEGTTNRVRLKEEKFLSSEMSLPPLVEQERVVTWLDELAAELNEAVRLGGRVRAETEALFESAVGREFQELCDSPKVALRNLTSKIGSGSTPLGGRATYPAAGVPFIRSLNVRMRRFQTDDLAYITTETHRGMPGTAVRPNDVLLNITGASIGRVACAPADIGEANVNQHVAIIRPTERLDARYLMYWLSQPAIQEFINSEQKGATRQGFTKAQIEAFEIPLPSMEAQRRLTSGLDELSSDVETAERLRAESNAELDAVIPAVLAESFGI